MKRPDLERQIAALASLREPVRRDLYLYVTGRGREVGRDEAARALRISRSLAAFHLDKLAHHGLLETSFRRLTGRRGPGAGRPAKLYRRAARQLALTLPPRNYELAARLFAQTLDDTGSVRTRRALHRTAGALGRSLGAAAARRGGAGGQRRRTLALLGEYGYEPVTSRSEIRLRNCPFEALTHQCRQLVCAMNLALLEGMVNGIGLRGARAELEPQPGMCCVVLKLAKSPKR